MALKVNGQEIPEADIDQEVERLRPDYDRLVRERNPDGGDDQLRQWSRDNVIERLLLRQEAAREPDPADDAAGGEAPGEEERLSRRLNRLMERVTASVAAPTEAEVREHYRRHRSEYRTPEQLRVAHIVKYTNEGQDRTGAYLAILNAKSELDRGAPFEALADRCSDCPGSGGDLGYFSRGQMVQAFDDAVFCLQPGETSTVFETPFGFHIARVYDRRPGGPLPLEQVREHVAGSLLQERRSQAMEAFVDGLKAAATLEES